MVKNIPLSLYIHLPWCIRKCPYCDFNSHAVSAEGIPNDVEQSYLLALINDWHSALNRHPSLSNRPLTSVFFGGGTPSLFKSQHIKTILDEVRKTIRMSTDCEITLEANPGTVARTDSQPHDILSHLEGFRNAGINRLSIGVQSFNDLQLHRLGRVHSANSAKETIAAAQQVFERINIDLMFGLPEQTLPQALADIHTALAYSPTHLSCYQLTIEPQTAFHRTPPKLPDEDSLSDMGQAISALLQSQGFMHYEISAFAKPGQECRHNLNYWLYGDYLGIGAGAHGKISNLQQDESLLITREVCWKHPDSYIQKTLLGSPLSESNSIAMNDRPLEWMMNALRLTQGFNLIDFENRTGIAFSSMMTTITPLIQKGLLNFLHDQRRLAPTPFGQRHLNYLLQHFLNA